MKSHRRVLIRILGTTLLPLLITACAQKDNHESPSYIAPAEPFPHFGRSLSYAVLGAQGISNSGQSIIYGDVGVSPLSSFAGMTTITRTGGENHLNDSTAAGAQSDAGTAYNNMQSAHCDHELTGQNLSGMTLTPGTYCFAGDANLSGLLTLDAQGSSRANFVFQVAGKLTTDNDAGMRVINGGETCNVFWQVVDTVSFGAGTNFIGGIIALSDITLNTGSKLNGKIMSRNGMISLSQNEIYNNFCPWW